MPQAALRALLSEEKRSMSINARVERLAKELGFEGVYFLPADSVGDTVDCERLSKYNCVLLLMYPYGVFKAAGHIPSYYIASNESYHAVKKLERQLNDEGIRAEKIYVPVKQLAAEHKIGAIGKNTLLHTEKWGSRVVLYTLLLGGAETRRYNEAPRDLCFGCKLCENACPSAAISDLGYCREKCIRNYMDFPPYPDWVAASIKTLLGCEACMEACPYNRNVPRIPVSQRISEALDLKRLASGDVKSAKELLGRNVKAKRLLADACAIMRNETKRCK